MSGAGSGGGARVLFHEAGAYAGGSVRSLLLLASDLVRAGLRPHVLFYYPNPIDAEFRAAGVPTEVLRPDGRGADGGKAEDGGRVPEESRGRTGGASPPDREEVPGLGRRIHESAPYRFLAYARAYRREVLPRARMLSAYIARGGFDLVHANNGLPYNHDLVLAAGRVKVPCVSHQRGFQSLHPLVRRVAGGVAKYPCISEAIAAHYRREGLPPERLVVVHNGVDLDAFPTGRRAPAAGGTSAPPAVGLVGRLVGWKGVEDFLEAAESLLASGLRARFVIAGEGPLEGAIRERVSRGAPGGPAGGVEFAGFERDIPALLSRLDVLVHAARDPEPFGRTILEGMAAGLPVVATDAGASPELVADGATGFLVPPRRPEILAAKIRALCEDPALRGRLGAAGRARAEARFSHRETSAKILAVYREVLGRDPAGSTGRPAGPTGGAA
jgi:glycosyltransferase involved in cell wall biosynthesis